MSDDYNDLYTVQQTADLLETNITNVYALIRANVLRNANLFSELSIIGELKYCGISITEYQVNSR